MNSVGPVALAAGYSRLRYRAITSRRFSRSPERSRSLSLRIYSGAPGMTPRCASPIDIAPENQEFANKRAQARPGSHTFYPRLTNEVAATFGDGRGLACRIRAHGWPTSACATRFEP
jgi:hypothetical protein